jgi:hypothetical protein
MLPRTGRAEVFALIGVAKRSDKAKTAARSPRAAVQL